MLEITNLAQVNDGLDRWLEDIEELAEGAYRGIAVEAFKYILEGSPEWTGNLAANWRLSVGAPAGYDETVWKHELLGTLGHREPFSKRDPNTGALIYATANAQEAVSEIRLGMPVFISNNSPYAWNVEVNVSPRGKPFIRLTNQPIEMVHAAADKFGAMGVISEAKALALAQERL